MNPQECHWARLRPVYGVEGVKPCKKIHVKMRSLAGEFEREVRVCALFVEAASKLRS